MTLLVAILTAPKGVIALDEVPLQQTIDPVLKPDPKKEVLSKPVETLPPIQEVVPATPAKGVNPSAEYVISRLSETFPEDGRMIPIVNCESGYEQFWPENDPYGRAGQPKVSPTSDVGIMQINQVHWPEAESLGLDIFNSPEDNIAMGRRVYDKQGAGAWTCLHKI